MRIFYAADTTPNASFESNLWRNNLYEPLVDLGHEVIEFDCDLRETFLYPDTNNKKHQKFITQNRPQISQKLLEQIQAAHTQKPIDIFFSYFYDACVLPETIEKIKAMGIITINWYCNAAHQLYLVSQIAPHYDYCLVPEKFRLDDYKKLGANSIYFQEAANPNIYKPYATPKEFDVTFVGQAYGERPDYIKYLLDNKIDVRVWGSGWQYFAKQENSFWGKIKSTAKFILGRAPGITLPQSIIGGVLSDAELIKTYSRSKINLSFSTCGNTHKSKERIMQIRLRDFEVPMSGGFYMTEYFQELEDFFELDKEIVCYNDKDDLVKKIKYYLAHDNKREAIAQAGRERCLKDHTWHKRFTTLFEQISLKSAPHE